MESTGIRAEIPPSPWRLSISLLVISEGLWALLRSPVENQNCSVFFWCVFEIAQLEGRKIQEEPQVSIQNSLDWVWSESPGGFGTPGLLQWKLMRSYNLEIKGRCKMRKGKVVVNSPTWLRFWGKFSLLMLLLSDEIQFCNPQKTNSLLWDRMPVYLPHWKFDFPWKAPEWLTKPDALFLPRLIGRGAFSTQIEQITFFQDEVLSECLIASKPKAVAVVSRGDSTVFLPWIFEELLSFLACTQLEGSSFSNGIFGGFLIRRGKPQYEV